MATTYVQKHWPAQLDTPMGPNALGILGFTGKEAISECYHLVLDLTAENPVQAAELLRKKVTVNLECADGSMRKIHGWVSRFVQSHKDNYGFHYEAEIVPKLWFLSLWQDIRIFQHKNALQVVETVLKDRSITFQNHTTAQPPVREYCVQYRESDLDFVSRLLEEEGIFYYFDHSGSEEELVLADGAASLPDCTTPRLSYRHLATLASEAIRSLVVESEVHVSKHTLMDYNMETPSSSLLRSVPSMTPGQDEELYDYPGFYPDGGTGEAQAKLRIGAAETMQTRIRGISGSRSLESGRKFTLEEHLLEAMNVPYLLVAVSHRLESATARTGDADAFDYESEFTAIPATQKYVPPRTHPRPLVHGSQTAVVVGTAGEEIYVDKYGRVKVQFFWDRKGQKDENSTCWVRVATQWAGKNWGTIHIPRIGQEVVVDFLEGNPDRPLITGSVYNAEQMPPYALPDNKTQSGIKSRSTQEGGTDNYNEIRFEDKKGSEHINVQAEKDLMTLVKNDETRTVKNDRTTTIHNNETRTVEEGNDSHTVKKGDQTVDVKQGDQVITVDEGKQTITVKQGDQVVDVKQGNQKITLGQGSRTLRLQVGDDKTTLDVGNQTVELKTGNRSIKVNLGAIKEEALQGIELKVGPSSIKLDPSGVTIKGLMVTVEGQVQTQVKGVMTQVNGSAMLQMQGAITMIN